MNQTGAGSKNFSKRSSFVKNMLWVVFISLVAAVFYKDVYRADFFLDDYLHLHLVDRIDNPFTPYYTNLFMGAFFRPGVFIFWKLNHVFFGLEASGYYATNVLFLLALLALTYSVLLNITGHRKFSALVTALFILSPVTNTGVIWLSNRFDLIGSVFYLTSLLLFLRYVRLGKRSTYLWAIAAGFFSYFCKELMITLPAVMVLTGCFMFYYRAELTPRRAYRILALSTPFFTLGVAFILWRYGVIHSMGGYSGETKVPFTPAYLKVLYVGFSDYFWLMRSRIVFGVYLALFLLLLAKRDFVRSNPLTVLGLALAVVTASPLIMILRIESVMTYMTPRFFFLPGLGMSIALASAFDPKSGPWRRRFAGLFLLLTAVFFGLNTFMSTYKWAEDRIENVAQMEKLNEYLEPRFEKEYPAPEEIYYVMLYGTDVALDAGMKVRYPQYLDKSYFLNPVGPTQVIGTEKSHLKNGKNFNWPKTFNKNPCNYEDLVYGVVVTQPRDIVESMIKTETVALVTKNRLGSLVGADKERVRGILATAGVLDHE